MYSTFVSPECKTKAICKVLHTFAPSVSPDFLYDLIAEAFFKKEPGYQLDSVFSAYSIKVKSMYSAFFLTEVAGIIVSSALQFQVAISRPGTDADTGPSLLATAMPCCSVVDQARTLYVVSWRYDDGSANGLIGAFFSEDYARHLVGSLSVNTECKTYSVVETKVV